MCDLKQLKHLFDSITGSSGNVKNMRWTRGALDSAHRHEIVKLNRVSKAWNTVFSVLCVCVCVYIVFEYQHVHFMRKDPADQAERPPRVLCRYENTGPAGLLSQNKHPLDLSRPFSGVRLSVIQYEWYQASLNSLPDWLGFMYLLASGCVLFTFRCFLASRLI